MLSPMSRASLLAAAFAALLPAPAALAADRPNVLWLTCEDISPDLGCYGSTYARTPALDRLAAEGVLYSNAFGITGVCAVNRSCLVTGMYSSSIGSQGMRSTIRLPEAIRCTGELLREAGYYATNNSKTDYNFPVPAEAWDACSGQAHYRDRKPGQPFFAVFNYTGTHESQIWKQNYERHAKKLRPGELHDPEDVPIPPFHPDVSTVRRDWTNYHDLITVLDHWIEQKLEELEASGVAEDTIVWFYSDHGAGMPGCKKWVWGSGLHVPLIIRFPDKWKHLAAGPPGTRTDRLVSFVDFAPTLLSLTDIEIPEVMQGVAFLGRQAGPPRKYIYGIRDRMAERFDIVRVVRDRRYQYLRNWYPHVPWSQFTSYTERMPTMQIWRELSEQGRLSGPPARYFQEKPAEELYDTQRDPHQVHNLAADPDWRDVLQRMRAASRDWMRRTHDLGLLPEHEMLRRASGRTQYDVARDSEANPLEELLAAADLANERDPERLEQLVGLLSDGEHPAVRWWAAVGLVALRGRAKPAEDALREALRDPAPNVRVAAAEALCQLECHAEALPVLNAALAHEASLIRLRAMNVLDRQGERACAALDAMRAAKMPAKTPTGERDHPSDYLNRMVDYVPPRCSTSPISPR